jgi:indolepyruvate ferredoxin oxidoreductase alpha subunit
MINPLPINKIKDFATSVEKVIVVEELDGIIESHCNNIGVKVSGKDVFGLIGEFSQNMVAEKLGEEVPTGLALDENIPMRPPVMCAGCPHRGLFYTLKKNKLTVMGDIGCYTLGAVAPLNAIDTTICMGASISSIHGFNKANEGATDGKTVAVIGDSTFMHSGVTGLINIAYNNSNSTVIILDNSITGMTGHQQNPTTGYNLKGDPAAKINLEALCKSVGINSVRVVDPYNLAECDTVIKEELAKSEPSVIISRRPCALLKYVKHAGPIKTNTDKCVGCKMCMQIGCPAVSMENGKVKIDNTLCTGCGVCSQMCKFDVFESVKGDK